MYSKRLMALSYLLSVDNKDMFNEVLDNVYDKNKLDIQNHVQNFWHIDKEMCDILGSISTPMSEQIEDNVNFSIRDYFCSIVEDELLSENIIERYLYSKIGNDVNELEAIKSLIITASNGGVEYDKIFTIYSPKDEVVFDLCVDILHKVKERLNLGHIYDVEYHDFKGVLVEYVAMMDSDVSTNGTKVPNDINPFESMASVMNSPYDLEMELDSIYDGFAKALGIDTKELKDRVNEIKDDIVSGKMDINSIFGGISFEHNSSEPKAVIDTPIAKLEMNQLIGALRDLDITFNKDNTYTDIEVEKLNKELRQKSMQEIFDEVVLHTLQRYQGNPISCIRQIVFKIAVALGVEIVVKNTQQFGDRKELMIFTTSNGEYKVAYKINHTHTKEVYEYIFSGYEE